MDIKLMGTLYARELTREDLIKDDISLQIIYDYQKTITDPVISYHMGEVLRMASDCLCNTCHEMNIDPLSLDSKHVGINNQSEAIHTINNTD